MTYFSSSESITLTVTRGSVEDGAQMGEYSIGDKTGYTLENDSKKINTGSYASHLSWYKSYRVIYLEDRDNRDNILVHRGNTKNVCKSVNLSILICHSIICYV